MESDSGLDSDDLEYNDLTVDDDPLDCNVSDTEHIEESNNDADDFDYRSIRFRRVNIIG